MGLEGHTEYMVLQKFYEVAKNYVQSQHVITFTSLNMNENVYKAVLKNSTRKKKYDMRPAMKGE